MDESHDSMAIQTTPAVVDPPDPVKLPGLRPILHARRIERKVLARQTGIDLNRLGNIVGTGSRANSDEVNRLTQALDVTLEQLLEPDTTPPRRRNSNADELDDDEVDEVSRDALPTLPEGEVVLNIALPDGRKFGVSSNQSLSATMLTRMSHALAILAGANEK